MNRQTDKVKVQETNGELEIDLLELFFYLRGRLIVLIAAFLIGAVLAGSYTQFFITPTYQATSKLYLVSASSNSVVDLSDLSLGSTLSSDYKELLKLRPILEEVIEDAGLDYSYGQLLGMMNVSTVSDSRILSITITSTDPVEAKNIANMVAEKAVTYLPDLMGVPAPNIAEYAIAPGGKSSPNMAKNTVQGALIGLLLAIGLYTVQFLLDDTLKTAEDVEKTFGVMPLCVIPEGDIGDKGKEKEKRSRSRERKKKGSTDAK
jgi:capsular polysaccharide biosynthesis protein